jgi:hypothetical protein
MDSDDSTTRKVADPFDSLPTVDMDAIPTIYGEARCRRCRVSLGYQRPNRGLLCRACLDAIPDDAVSEHEWKARKRRRGWAA